MKINKSLKLAGLVALVLSMAVGCAAQPAAEGGQAEQAGVTAAEAQQAIDAAQAAIDEAKAAGALWRDTQDILDKAKEAFANGDYTGAKRLADMARRQAENALDQKRREEARLQGMMETEAAARVDEYVVERGDSLWTISAKDSIYGNPFQWPLIYKANSDRIRDADLIYPGQQFRIERGASVADTVAAIRHAKNRGAWAVGRVEQSDRDYLAGQ